MDFEAAGLLDGLDGEEREARLRLLESLSHDGVDLDELREAVAEDRLSLLPVQRLLRGRYSAREVENEMGLSAEILLRLRRLTGLPEAGPEDRVFNDEDLTAAQSLKLFLDSGFDEQTIAQITLVLGEGMARLAATVAAGFAESFLEAGDTEEEVAERFASLAGELTPALTPVLSAAFRAHLSDAASRAMLSRDVRASGQLADSQDVAVCFADLVGFTRLGGEVDVHELGSVAVKLAELANDVAKGEVRLVKTIGDAAMFVSGEAAPLVEAAITIVEAAEEAELPALRAGLALGRAQQRSGDFYGHAVNLSSRVTGIARPGSVLCTQEIRDAAAEEFAWSFAGRHRLKGLPEPVALHRARRLGAGEETVAEPEGEESPKRRKGDRRRR